MGADFKNKTLEQMLNTPMSPNIYDVPGGRELVQELRRLHFHTKDKRGRWRSDNFALLELTKEKSDIMREYSRRVDEWIDLYGDEAEKKRKAEQQDDGLSFKGIAVSLDCAETKFVLKKE